VRGIILPSFFYPPLFLCSCVEIQEGQDKKRKKERMTSARFVVLVSFCFFFGIAFASSIPFVVAHRGYSGVAPENTIPAFVKAAEVGCAGIEIDVLYTKDNQLVVIHDETLDRTTNCSGLVNDSTYEELKDCDASYVQGQNFSQYRGTKIPLLSEVIAIAMNYSMFVVIDYKSSVPIGASVKEVMDNYTTMTSLIYGSCWYPWQMEDFGANLPGAPRQYLTSGVNTSAPGFWDTVVGAGANGFSIRHSTINKDFVDQAHSRLLSVAVWTVNNETEMGYAVSYGVDAILTDYPPLLLQVIQNYNNPPEENIYIHVHIYVLVACAVVVFALVATSVGAAFFFWRRSKYMKLSDA